MRAYIISETQADRVLTQAGKVLGATDDDNEHTLRNKLRIAINVIDNIKALLDEEFASHTDLPKT